MSNSQPQNAAYYLLEALVELEVEYLFGNLGTDHAPLIEEMARWQQQGRPHPQLILCPHENTAMHMAAGYALATGRGQAVLVHVDAGTANAAMGMHNLFRARIPALLIAGKAPFSSYGELEGGRDTYVHFVQEPYDQASVVRPYSKWEYSLTAPEITKEVLGRASAIMHSDPMGPAYLMLPREILAQQCAPEDCSPVSMDRFVPVKAGGVNPAVIHDIAQRLINAERPLLITAYAGRNPNTPALIERLALLAGIRVAEFNTVYLNISRESPCFAGFQPGPFVPETDFGLLIDVDVPWIPKNTQENPDTYWVHCDVDAIKRDIPMWSFPAHQRLEADSYVFLQALIQEVERLATADFNKRAQRRVDDLRIQQQQRQQQEQQLAHSPGEFDALNPHFLCAALGQKLKPNDVVLNEAIMNAPAVFTQIPRTQGGSLIGLPGGGLGFSAGVALGLKLARTDDIIVQVVGDGSFYFSNPSSMLSVAQQYHLPVLSVILDNTGWAAVKSATLRMYPKGEAHAQNRYGAQLAPQVDFAQLAASAGAHGELLQDPAHIDAALERALAAVRNGQSAVVHARIARL